MASKLLFVEFNVLLTLLLSNLLLSPSALATKCNKTIDLSNYPLFDRQIRLTRLGIPNTLHFRHHGSCTIGTERSFVCILYTYYIPEFYMQTRNAIFKRNYFKPSLLVSLFLFLRCISFYKWIFQWYFPVFFWTISGSKGFWKYATPSLSEPEKSWKMLGRSHLYLNGQLVCLDIYTHDGSNTRLNSWIISFKPADIVVKKHNQTVDDSEIHRTSSYCWWKESRTTTWDVYSLANNGIKYQPQLAHDFFYQQQVFHATTYLSLRFAVRFRFHICPTPNRATAREPKPHQSQAMKVVVV